MLKSKHTVLSKPLQKQGILKSPLAFRKQLLSREEIFHRILTSLPLSQLFPQSLNLKSSTN